MVAMVATRSLTILGHLLAALHLVLVEPRPQELGAHIRKQLFNLIMGLIPARQVTLLAMVALAIMVLDWRLLRDFLFFIC
jgi:hypothetical protein